MLNAAAAAAALTMDVFLSKPHAERVRVRRRGRRNDQKCAALLARSRSRRVSHVFPFEKKAGSFAGNRIFHLVKMNCHVCLTDACNEISVGTFQRGNVGNERRANPLTRFHAATFILDMVPRKLLPSRSGNELSSGSGALFIRAASAAGEPSLKRKPLC